MSDTELSDFLTRRGYVYVRECPECGAQTVKRTNEDGTEYEFCTNYGGCEYAPG